MEDEASMTVGPATAALSQMTRMSSARSATLPSSRLLSTRSHNSRHGGSHAPSLVLPVVLQFILFCVGVVMVSRTHNFWAANHFVHCVTTSACSQHHSVAHALHLFCCGISSCAL